MGKKGRQQKMLELIRTKRLTSQQDVLAALASAGIEAKQASISRDLTELGIAKVKGVYVLPQLHISEKIGALDFDTAGDHLIVIHTGIGKSMAIAASIDELKLSEVVGTIAGDDTIFLATKNSAMQKQAIQKILRFFSK